MKLLWLAQIRTRVVWMLTSEIFCKVSSGYIALFDNLNKNFILPSFIRSECGWNLSERWDKMHKNIPIYMSKVEFWWLQSFWFENVLVRSRTFLKKVQHNTEHVRLNIRRYLLYSVRYTEENWRVKLETFFSHATEVKLYRLLNSTYLYLSCFNAPHLLILL
jgi:hypothetical protein